MLKLHRFYNTALLHFIRDTIRLTVISFFFFFFNLFILNLYNYGSVRKKIVSGRMARIYSLSLKKRFRTFNLYDVNFTRTRKIFLDNYRGAGIDDGR